SCDNFALLTSSPSDEYIIPGSLPNSNIDCSFISGECQYTYIAGRRPDGEDLYAVPPRICLPIPIWAIVTILLVLIILLGIGILIAIKCCCMYLDYKEYNSFKAEVSKASFEKMENPMYHTPDVTYKNIAYGSVITIAVWFVV
uniref:Integrin beta subunit cytoplasmic domain-containing protein n=1 Tax=Amphimedon queenslandica TaxID=400682 RepID=A0A1X7SV05_AMPQE